MIIITGITGWLGRTCLKYFLENYKEIDFSKNVMVFASKNGILNINNRSIRVYDFNLLSELGNDIKVSHIFHTAFLTKEKIQSFGKEEYKNVNLRIIDTIEKLLDSNPDIRIAITSSGAALSFLEEKEDELKDLYGYLKAIEEKKLSKYSNALILRIFALTGYFIRSPEVFALSEFIHSAIKQKTININANGVVLRGYGSAEEIVSLGWRWLFSEDNCYAVNCVSHNVDLLKIAEIIQSIIGNIEIYHNINFKKIISNYSADPGPFKEALLRANVKQISLIKQVELSISGIRKFSY